MKINTDTPIGILIESPVKAIPNATGIELVAKGLLGDEESKVDSTGKLVTDGTLIRRADKARLKSIFTQSKSDTVEIKARV